MFINYNIAIIIQLFIILVLIPAYSQNTSESDTIIIKSINIKKGVDDVAVESIDYKNASMLAYNTGLTLLPDAPPVIDNNGFFIKQIQVEIPVTGYKRELFYKAYFDFFRYKEKKIPFNTKLKISIKDIYGNIKHVGTAETSCMTGNNLFEVDIPYDLSYQGKFYIVLHEYAQKAEHWGIWDIIVTSRKISELDENFIKSLLKSEDTRLKISH
jgi:hypothetical protein